MSSAPPREPTFLVVVAAVVILAIVAGLARSPDDDADDIGEPDAAYEAAVWDERLGDLVAFVEDERGLPWKAAVPTAFLAEEDFRERVTESDAPTAEEARELEQLSGVLRALGLVEGELDLEEATDQLLGESVLGFYDIEAKEIVVRGDEITPAMRPTIVHELTHALQGQHFDLDPELDDSGEEVAFRTLVESDASRIEDAYVATLSEAEREAYLDGQAADVEGQDLSGLPPFLVEVLGLPYALGPPWLQTVIDERGADSVDDVFESPPQSEEHIALPSSFLDGDAVADVATPALADGEVAFGEEGDFGMISLLLVLGERLPWGEAWAAVQGWAGDASVTYRDVDDRDCIRVHVEVDGDAAADRLGAAFDRWIGTAPHASVATRGDLVTFESCDPGTDAVSVARPDEPRAFEVLALRAGLIQGLSAGAERLVAECVADRLLLVDPGPSRVAELATASDPRSPEGQEVQRLLVDALQACEPD